jgi:heat shock protein HspQ
MAAGCASVLKLFSNDADTRIRETSHARVLDILCKMHGARAKTRKLCPAICGRWQAEGAPMRYAAVILLIVSAVACSSCVANRVYRWGENKPPAIVPANPGADPNEPKYDLAFLEFDDMGEFWTIGDLHHFQDQPKASQLSEVLDLIKQRKEEADTDKSNLVVIAFIHGWHNNASQYDETHDKSLYGFKTLMQYRATHDKKAKYIGIFIAWRGQAIPGDLLVSYWNRRDAAARLGSPSFSEAVFRLMFATKGTTTQPEISNKCQSANADPSRAQFIVIGHSFGARILEGAVAQPFLTMLLERQSQTLNCIADAKKQGVTLPEAQGSFRSPADMIVLLNSANDAFKTKAMIEAMKRMNLKVTRPNASVEQKETASPDTSSEMDAYGPLILSITSQGDWATARVMPVLQAVSTVDKEFRSYDPDWKELGQESERSQKYYFLRNEGHINEFLTHNVELAAASECTDHHWPYFHGEDGCYRVVPIHKWNDTPFWVMSVSTHIIPNHEDVFKPGLIDLLESVLDRYAPTSGETNLSGH